MEKNKGPFQWTTAQIKGMIQFLTTKQREIGKELEGMDSNSKKGWDLYNIHEDLGDMIKYFKQL